MSMIFQCAQCKQVFKKTEGSDVEAAIKAQEDFPQDFISMNNYGGLHEVCEDCYHKAMNKGLNTEKIQVGKKPIYKIIWDKLHRK